MKKLLLSLLVLLSCVMSMNATVTTFDFTKPADLGYTAPATGEGTDLAVDTTIVKDGITITVTKMGNTKTRFYNSKGAIDLRAYTNAVFTITSSGDPITKMVFAGSSVGDMKSDVGAYSTDTWLGNSNTVVLTLTATLKATSLEVTTGAPAAVQAPTFSILGGNFITTQNIELTSATAGASIYYTTDGADPTAASTKYTGAIAVSKTTTIKAIAINGADKSDIVTATYTFPNAVADVAAFAALNSDDYVQFSNPVTAIFQTGSNLYVKDASGYMMVYGPIDQTYKSGDVIPAGFAGTKASLNGIPELKTPIGFAAGTTGTAVEPAAATLDALTTADMGKYVKLSNVTVDLTAKTLKSGTTTVPYYNTLKITLPTTAGVYDVVGVVMLYKDAPEILPVTVTVPAGINDIEATTVNNAKTYDVQGRQISAPVKGQLYIKANKKFIAK